MSTSRRSCCRNGLTMSPAPSQPVASDEVPHAGGPPPRPPIWICPAGRWYRQCYRPGRAPKIHLGMPNAIGQARQFRWTRAASCWPPDFVGALYRSNRGTGRALVAQAIAIIAVVLAPTVVIIGGGLSRAGDLLLGPINEHLPRLLPVAPPQVLQSALGEEAAAIGAIYIALQLADASLYESVAKGR